MNEADEDEKLRKLYVDYASTDPLWLDLARAGERLLVTGGERQDYEFLQDWMAVMPSRHLARIGAEWLHVEVKSRAFIAAVSLVLVDVPMHKRNTVGILRVMHDAKIKLYAARNPDVGTVSKMLAEERKLERSLDAMLNAKLDDPLRLAGDIGTSRSILGRFNRGQR